MQKLRTKTPRSIRYAERFVPIIDANLDGYDSNAWYTFLDPIILAAFIYAFGPGGPEGNRTNWLDPETGTRWFKYELIFGVGPNSWRAAQKNPG